MKTAFITTINTNIGDDFIRTGIENLLEASSGDRDFSHFYINKHIPETILSRNSPLHLINRLPDFRGKHTIINFYYRYLHDYFNRLSSQDLVIQSGAPVLWPGCYKSEWAGPVWYDTIGKHFREIPVLNLAAGSCYPWENQEGFMDDQEATFATDIGGFCRLTTTRDRLASKLFSEAGVDNELLPCTALFVDPTFENDDSGEYILVNYMEGGGHFEWDQHIDNEKWESTIKKLIRELAQHHEVRFICHSEKELELANKLYPDFRIHFPETTEDYLECIRYAKIGINNRMHATIAMASLGVPSVSIGTDTRLLMQDQIDLPVFYVKDVEYEQLLDTVNNLLDKLAFEKNRLFELKRDAFARYRELLLPYVN